MRDTLKDQSFEPEMPVIECGRHLVDYLWTWGPTMVGGMGEGPLTQAELAACQANSGIELSAWEAQTLARLSREYMGESYRASKPDCAPPFGDGLAQRRFAEADMARKLNQFLD